MVETLMVNDQNMKMRQEAMLDPGVASGHVGDGNLTLVVGDSEGNMWKLSNNSWVYYLHFFTFFRF
jgi:hypothetical protein